MNEYRREVRFEPGHVLRKTTGPDYGIASMKIRFLLHGEHGTTQFLMFTGWYPERTNGRYGSWHTSSPSGADLGVHWDVPWAEYMLEPDSYAHMDDCDFRPQGHCWYDGSGLRADELLAEFFVHGEAVVWASLEDEYRRTEADALALTTDR